MSPSKIRAAAIREALGQLCSCKFMACVGNRQRVRALLKKPARAAKGKR